jgi:hypothetical protein
VQTRGALVRLPGAPLLRARARESMSGETVRETGARQRLPGPFPPETAQQTEASAEKPAQESGIG